MSDKLIRKKLEELVTLEKRIEEIMFGFYFKHTSLQTYLAKHATTNFTVDEIQQAINDVKEYLKELEESYPR